MEQNDKIRLLLDMHEHPENYTDEQLTAMLDDELLEHLAQAKRALTDIPEPDVDAEWQRFEQEHFALVKSRRWLKVAAMFIGVLMLSAFTYAAIYTVHHRATDKVEENSEIIVPATQAESAAEARLGVADTTAAPPQEAVVFDNQPLGQMMEDIAARYDMHVDFRNEEARDLRFYFELHAGEDLSSVVERLNMFERVSVSIEGNTIVVE